MSNRDDNRQRNLFDSNRDAKLTTEEEEALDRYEEAKEGRRLRDEGMATVALNAGSEWARRAMIIVLAVARATPDGFTTDDVWRAGLEKPHNGKALGPVMAGLARQGLIVATNQIRNSYRREAHAGPKRVWRKA